MRYSFYPSLANVWDSRFFNAANNCYFCKSMKPLFNNYVIGIGEALWDMLPGGKKLGGAPANFAYHARQFGLEGMAVSAIGHDALGEEIVEALEAHALPYHLCLL